MKKHLLFAVMALSGCLAASAQSSDSSKSADGTTPPSPESPYYVDLINTNTYYGMTLVEGSNPEYYEVSIPQTNSDFKIYASGYWTESENSGYNQNDYIYGSPDGSSSGVTLDTPKQLSQPGNNLLVENGGIWYNCTYKFYPSGTTGNGTPELVVSGGTQTPPPSDPGDITELYMIGDFTTGTFNLSDAIEGDALTNHLPNFEDAENIFVWVNAPLSGTMRFRFANMKASSWSDLESNGTQYYPDGEEGSGTLYCANFWDDEDVDTGNWYLASGKTGVVNSAWAPLIAATKSTDNPAFYYQVFFNTKTMKAAVAWGLNTGIENVPEAVQNEKPVNVYDIYGRIIKTNVMPSEAVKTLPQGIYIVGNKKLIIEE